MNATSASSGTLPGKALRDPRRVAAVRADGLIGSAQEEAFDRHARLARLLLKAHAGYVTFVDDAYVFFKSTTGDDEGGGNTGRIEAARSFCGYVVDTQEVMLIGDARLDARFAHFPRVRDGQVRASAGAPGVGGGGGGARLGVRARPPRQWSEDEVQILCALAGAVATEVELYRRNAELQRTEARLRQREAELSLCLGAAEIGAFVERFDAGRSSADARTLAFFGYSPEEWDGTLATILARIVPEDRARVTTAIERALQAGEPYLCEFRTQRPDGSQRWLAARGRVDRDASGAYLFGVNFDITERKRQEGELLESRTRLRDSEERLRLALDAACAGTWELAPATGELMASVRVREMLGFAPGTLLTLQRALEAVHPEDRQRTRAALQDTVASGRPFQEEFRVAAPAGPLRWLAAHAELQVRGTHTRVVGLLQDITERRAAAASLEASEAFIRQVTDVAPAVLYLYDLVERRNVWGNREMTAVLGYTREQIDAMAGSLLQQLMHPEDWTRYLVYARTLARLLLPHVFDLYTQADGSLERSQGGLGIGLALVKSLVERHGGSVQVASQPGAGATFTVRLPRCAGS